MALSPESVLKKLDKSDLLTIAEYRNIPVAAALKDNPDADVAKIVSDEVSSYGLWLVLSAMSTALLQDISKQAKLEYPGTLSLNHF